MSWFTAVVLYVLIWWTVLFAVLPLWTRPVDDADVETGGWRGAPEHPFLLRKVVTTTLVAAVLWGGGMALIQSPYLSFRDMAQTIPDN